jgi:hypothetical protein
MKKVRTPSGMRCQTNKGKFTKCRKGTKSNRRGLSGLCRKSNGQFASCRKGTKRA